jgi:hypothetical protein
VIEPPRIKLKSDRLRQFIKKLSLLYHVTVGPGVVSPLSVKQISDNDAFDEAARPYYNIRVKSIKFHPIAEITDYVLTHPIAWTSLP